MDTKYTIIQRRLLLPMSKFMSMQFNKMVLLFSELYSDTRDCFYFTSKCLSIPTVTCHGIYPPRQIVKLLFEGGSVNPFIKYYSWEYGILYHDQLSKFQNKVNGMHFVSPQRSQDTIRLHGYLLLPSEITDLKSRSFC